MSRAGTLGTTNEREPLRGRTVKNRDLLDSRIPIAIALCLAAAGGSAQDGIGPAHDADAAGVAIFLGELSLAGEIGEFSGFFGAAEKVF